MNQMTELVAALEDDKRDYEERTVWVAGGHAQDIHFMMRHDAGLAC